VEAKRNIGTRIGRTRRMSTDTMHHETHEEHERRCAARSLGRGLGRENSTSRRDSQRGVSFQSVQICEIGGPGMDFFRTFSAHRDGAIRNPGRRFALPWAHLWRTFSSGKVMPNRCGAHLRESAASADIRQSNGGVRAPRFEFLPFVGYMPFVVVVLTRQMVGTGWLSPLRASFLHGEQYLMRTCQSNPKHHVLCPEATSVSALKASRNPSQEQSVAEPLVTGHSPKPGAERATPRAYRRGFLTTHGLRRPYRASCKSWVTMTRGFASLRPWLGLRDAFSVQTEARFSECVNLFKISDSPEAIGGTLMSPDTAIVQPRSIMKADFRPSQ